MTTANKITIARILLIPVFILFAAYYGRSVVAGAPLEYWRWIAVGIFVLAAASDGLDGFIARRYNQRSRLGVILDPLADKGLLVAALVTLSVTGWPGLPLWFAVLVIARDVINIAGAVVIHHLIGKIHVEPHWTGKTATFLLMVSLGWVMLGIPYPSAMIWIILASVFVVVSGTIYTVKGLRQIPEALHHDSHDSHHDH